MTESNRVTFPLVSDRESMDEVTVGLARIQLHDVSFPGGGTNGDYIRILLGPVEGCVVWELVANQKLFVVDLRSSEALDLAQTKPITGNIDDQEAWLVLSRVRRPPDCSFHLINHRLQMSP